MIIDSLQRTIEENRNVSQPYLRNLLKEVLQLYTLNFIFTSSYAEKFLFKGGTCLRFCFDLPRLSEDLDFDIKDFKKFPLEAFLEDVKNYFVKNLQFKEFSLKLAGNKKEIYLKFPMMEKLGLRLNISESSVLFVRIDISPVLSSLFKEEISLKTTYDFSFIIKRYSLSDLFASKIAAIINRTFQKGEGPVAFKGRDYFDLIWFLEKKITPNFKLAEDLTKIKTRQTLLHSLDAKVDSLQNRYLKEDLLPFFAEAKFVEEFTDNFKTLYRTYRKNLD